MKNLFKRKKDKFPKPATPRPLDAIKQEYGELRAKAGDIQYRLYVNKEDLRLVNERLLQVNQEANDRMALDQAAAKPTATLPVETTSQQ